jgi:hypothetical protein
VLHKLTQEFEKACEVAIIIIIIII